MIDPTKVTPGQLAEAVLAAVRQRNPEQAHKWGHVIAGNKALRTFCGRLVLAYGLDVKGVNPDGLVAALVMEGVAVGVELQQILQGRAIH